MPLNLTLSHFEQGKNAQSVRENPQECAFFFSVGRKRGYLLVVRTQGPPKNTGSIKEAMGEQLGLPDLGRIDCSDVGEVF